VLGSVTGGNFWSWPLRLWRAAVWYNRGVTAVTGAKDAQEGYDQARANGASRPAAVANGVWNAGNNGLPHRGLQP
jgi:hypothetical protein